MFCRNCGAQIPDQAAICVKCGVAGPGATPPQPGAPGTPPPGSGVAPPGSGYTPQGSGYTASPPPGYAPPPGYVPQAPGYPPPAPGYAPPGYGPPAYDPTAKSRLVAGLLAIFLGGFGVHRFYLGYVGIGVLQLLTCGGLGIWSLIEAILILTGSGITTDARGVPLRD